VKTAVVDTHHITLKLFIKKDVKKLIEMMQTRHAFSIHILSLTGVVSKILLLCELIVNTDW